MSESLLLPYDILQGNDWSVDGVLYTIQSKSELRTQLANLAQFNVHRINSKDLDPSQEYCYLELSSISAETGLIDNPQYLLGELIPTRGKLLAKKGDILLSTVRPERGLVAIISEQLDNCIVSNGFVVLTPRKISSELLWLVLRSERVLGELKLMASGTTIPTLKISKLKEYGLPFQPKDLWGEMAQKLYAKWESSSLRNSSLSDVIEKVFTEQLLEREEIAEVPNNIFLLPYERLDSDRMDVNFYYQTLYQPLILWRSPLIPLGNLINTVRPTIGSSTNFIQLGAQHLDEDEIFVNSDVVKSQNTNTKKSHSNLTLLSTGNLVIARISNNGIKKCGLVPSSIDGTCASPNILVFSIDSVAVPEFIACYLKSRWAQMQYDIFGLPTITVAPSEIKKINMPLPSNEQQELIIEKIEQELEKQDTSRILQEIYRLQDQIITKVKI